MMTPSMTALVLGAAAIDIDVTVLFQFVTFALVVTSLNFIIIQPYLKAREAREEGTTGSMEEAEETQARAQSMGKEYDERSTEARRDAMEVRETMRGQGLAEQRDMIEEAREEIMAGLEQDRRHIASMVADAESQLEERAKSLANMIADKVAPEAA